MSEDQTKASHTPGPWRYVDNRNMTGAIWIAAKTGSLAEVRPGCEEAMEEGDTEANARLIAAAPELLAACKLLVEELVATRREHRSRDWTMDESIKVDSIESARVAIAKAEGWAS